MDKILENNEKPREDDLAILLTIPFMTSDLDKRKELIFKTAKIALRLNIGDKDLMIEIAKNQILLAQTVLNTDEFLEFMEVIRMSDEDDVYKIGMYIKQAKEELAYKEGVKIGEKKGMKIGEKRGEEKTIKKLTTAVKMVNDGSSLEEASEATGLSLSQISPFCGK